MKVVLITGASRGLGLEFTKQFLNNGKTVIATCRRPDSADDLHTLKAQYDDNLTILKLDVTLEEERKRVFEAIRKRFDHIDVLVNNAGIIAGDENSPVGLGMIHQEDFLKVIQVNSLAPLLMSERFLPLLERSESGKIVNMSSLNGSITQRTVGGKYSYATSKAALNMISRILSNDLREKGIVVLAIHPGWLKTDMGGPEAPQEKEGPISQIIDLIERSDLSHSGKFLDWTGKELPW